MAQDVIKTADSTPVETSTHYREVSGTTVGTKRALDVAVVSGGSNTAYAGGFITWTVDTASYAVDDQFGDVEAFDVLSQNDGVGFIESIVLIDDDKLKLDLDIFIFDSQPTLTSTDNAALAMTAANLQKCRIRVEVRECDWSDLSGQSIADVPVGKTIVGAGGDTNLYIVIQKKVLAATPVATDSVSLALNMQRD